MMNSQVDIAVMIGSAVPASLQAVGQRVCWVVLVNGERRGTAFASREEALECQRAWQGSCVLSNGWGVAPGRLNVISTFQCARQFTRIDVPTTETFHLSGRVIGDMEKVDAGGYHDVTRAVLVGV